MADMKPDIIVGPTWVKAATAAGIAAGARMEVQNKGNYPLCAYIGASAPAVPAGNLIRPFEVWEIDPGSTLWLRADTSVAVSVQEK